MLAGGVAGKGAPGRSRSLSEGGKGVTTDKPFVLEACVRDKMPVCCVLGGKSLVAGRRRGEGAGALVAALD